MTDRPPSETALAVAALRAAHRLFDAPPWILDDPLSARLLDPTMLGRMRDSPDQLAAPAARALRCHVLLRSRYAEDRLAAAVQRGVRQCLILGAGYDTFAYRQPAWAGALRIFELDHPASQLAKRERLDVAGIGIPDNVEYVAVDFDVETIQAGLLRSRFDPRQPTFVSCLGVLVHVARESVKGVFGFAAALPPLSEMAFTFSPPDEADEPAAASAAAAGEPWRTRLTYHQLGEMLASIGFTAVDFLTPDDAVQRYIGTHEGALPAPRGVRIGSARVG